MGKSSTENFEFASFNNREKATSLFYRDNAWISFQDLATVTHLDEDKLIETLGGLLKTNDMMDEYVYLHYLPIKKDIYGMEEPPEYIEFFSLEVAVWLRKKNVSKSEILEKYIDWASQRVYEKKQGMSRTAFIYVLAYGICTGMSTMVSAEVESVLLTIAVAIIFLATKSSILFFLGTILLLIITTFLSHSASVLTLPAIALAFIIFGSLKSRKTTQFSHRKELFSYGYENFRDSVLGLK